MTIQLRRLTCLLMFAVLACATPLRAADALIVDLVKPTLVADTTAIEPGKPFTIGVHFKIAPKWHIYWAHPGEAGIPTSVELQLPQGFTASAIQYPTPHRFVVPGNIVLYGYADEAMLIATITPPTAITGKDVTIKALTKFLACDESCIPGEANLSLTLPVSPARPSESQPQFARWTSQLPATPAQSKAASVQGGTVTPSATQKTEGLISYTINWTDAPPEKMDVFPAPSDGIIFSNVKTETKGKTTTITATVVRLIGTKLEAKVPNAVVGFDTPLGRRGIGLPIVIPENLGW